jgi:hypothetical protein
MTGKSAVTSKFSNVASLANTSPSNVHHGQTGAVQQVCDVVAGLTDLDVPVLQLLVQSVELFVARLQFLLRGFQFFVRALQFLVAREDFLVGALELLVGRFLIADDAVR